MSDDELIETMAREVSALNGHSDDWERFLQEATDYLAVCRPIIEEEWQKKNLANWAHKQMAQDRAEILRLRAENEKLRAAMTAFMDAYYKQMRLQGWSDLDVFYNDDYRAAAAALKETGDE